MIPVQHQDMVHDDSNQADSADDTAPISQETTPVVQVPTPTIDGVQAITEVDYESYSTSLTQLMDESQLTVDDIVEIFAGDVETPTEALHTLRLLCAVQQNHGSGGEGFGRAVLRLGRAMVRGRSP